MRWESLDARIPYVLVLRGRLASIPIYTSRDDPERGVAVKQPGKHWQTKTIPGGDFQVVVSSPDFGGTGRALRFEDVVGDFQRKRDYAKATGTPFARAFGQALDRRLQMIGDGSGDPLDFARQVQRDLRSAAGGRVHMPGLDWPTAFVSLQCYALAEHRKYGAEQELKGGGRKLLPRVLRGVVLGKWTASEVAGVLGRTDSNRRGRVGGLAALLELETEKGWSSEF